jgi:hypothetical protein
MNPRNDLEEALWNIGGMCQTAYAGLRIVEYILFPDKEEYIPVSTRNPARRSDDLE